MEQKSVPRRTQGTVFAPCSRLQLLPREMWLHVLGFLSPSDRLKVRCVCKEFRDLVDCSSLWRRWTVRLKRRHRSYNPGFWKTLRRRSVTSVVLSSLKDCTTISTNLPGLSTVIIDYDCEGSWRSLQSFTNLKQVYVNHHRNPESKASERLFAQLPTTLTHLSICEYDTENSVTNKDLGFLTQMTNLRFLVCHVLLDMPPAVVLRSILRALPRLTHLSVVLETYHSSLPFSEEPPVTHGSLCSLEVIGSVHTLPEDTMTMLPSLRSLALFIEGDVSMDRKLCAWLKELPALTSLLVVRGPAVKDFVRSIPSSVRDLTLRSPNMSVAELKALSQQLPLLLRLELRESLAGDTALIPELFPKLRCLRVCHRDVPEASFLRLAELKDLRLLETRDPLAPPEKLVLKLRDLTENRLCISQKRKRDNVTCWCLDDPPSKTWIQLGQ